MLADNLYQLKPKFGYWNKYTLPKYPLRKRNKFDTEEQLRFENLQRELFRIINKINDGVIDGPYYKVSVACKRRNGKLYIKILYDFKKGWVTHYMVDLHKKIYKNEYIEIYHRKLGGMNIRPLKEPLNEGKDISNSEFYSTDVMNMIIEFVEYSEQKLIDESIIKS